MTKTKEYAKLAAKIKELEAQQAQLKLEILDEMEKNGETKTVTEYGTFSRATRQSWTYSDAVVAKEEQLKVLKIKEQQRGTATASITTYLVYHV